MSESQILKEAVVQPLKLILPQKILCWLLVVIAAMVGVALFRIVVLGGQLQIGPTPVFITNQPANIDLLALQKLMNRVRIEPDGAIHVLADTSQENGSVTVVDYGNGASARHVQLETGGHIQDYPGRYPVGMGGPSKTLN